MLKNILSLNGAQELSKADQKAINGGGSSRGLCIDQCLGGAPCGAGESCVHFQCLPAGNNDPFTFTYGLCVGDGGGHK